MSIVRWNLKEAGGKVPTRGTRITSGIQSGMSLQNKTKSNKLHGHEDVNGRVHGMKVTRLTVGGLTDVMKHMYESRLKQDLS